MIVSTVGDITDDIQELIQFMMDAEECGIMVYSMDLDLRQWNNCDDDTEEEDKK